MLSLLFPPPPLSVPPCEYRRTSDIKPRVKSRVWPGWATDPMPLTQSSPTLQPSAVLRSPPRETSSFPLSTLPPSIDAFNPVQNLHRVLLLPSAGADLVNFVNLENLAIGSCSLLFGAAFPHFCFLLFSPSSVTKTSEAKRDKIAPHLDFSFTPLVIVR